MAHNINFIGVKIARNTIISHSIIENLEFNVVSSINISIVYSSAQGSSFYCDNMTLKYIFYGDNVSDFLAVNKGV